jgi:hypothetical protein
MVVVFTRGALAVKRATLEACRHVPAAAHCDSGSCG